MTWNFRLASHLGYLSPDQPLYRESVNSADPWKHVAYAAAHGLAGVLYPWAISRPEAEVARFRAALEHFSLEAGCVVYAPLDAVMAPLWVRADDAARTTLKDHLDRSIPLARSLGSRTLAVLVAADVGMSRAAQDEALVDNLLQAGDCAARAGLTIGIEPMTALPNMLLRSFAEARELMERVGHPSVKLIFDTGHVQVMEGDVLATYRAVREHVAVLQLADMPDRVEPGAGTIDFVALLGQALRDSTGDSLIELEHSWSTPGEDVERRGIDTLREIDMAAGNAIAKYKE